MTIDDNLQREGHMREHIDAEETTADDHLGTNRDLGTGQGRQGGANGCGTRQRKKARSAGTRDERRRLADGRWGKSPGGI